LYTRLKIAIAGKACKKLPAYGRKKACNPAGQRPVIKTNISARMPGKAAGLRLLGKAAGQGCRARVQYAPLSWQVTIIVAGHHIAAAGYQTAVAGYQTAMAGYQTAVAGYQTACMHSAVMYCNGRIPNCMHARSLINVSPTTTKQN
jgi:hypothetical protein